MAPVPGPRTDVTIEGRTLSLSNLGKVLYPAAGFTKAQVIDYYTQIAPAMLPHSRGRPMTLKRYPNGVDQPFFFEKQCPSHAPEWVRTHAIWSGDSHRDIDYCLVDDLPTLVWLANLAALELHPLLSRAPDVERPTAVVFDLDPGAPADVLDCGEVALAIRALVEPFGLQVLVKTSGSKGLQVYLPLNTPVTFDETKTFAHAVAQTLERRMEGRVVSIMAKAVRAGRVFVDWSQNDQHKTTIGVYSLRAREHPTVSTPLEWAELESAVRSKDRDSLVFTAPAVLERVKARGDLFALSNDLEQTLPRL
jgi:bifunctional non-homologous end joining protein LigD